MANRTQVPPQTAGHPMPSRPTPIVRSIRRSSVIAGAALLLMAALAGFGYMVAIQGLVAYDNATKNASNIIESSQLFLTGIVSLSIVIALDVVVAWALYRVFAAVSKTVSAVGAWMRIVYGAIFAVAVGQLVSVLRLLTTGAGTAESTDLRYAEALTAVNRFADIYDAGLILFGLHLLVIGWLAFKADYMPTWLGVLLFVSGAGYVFDGVGVLLSAGSWTDVSTVTFIGEFLLAVWLVVRGRQITLDDFTTMKPPTPGDWIVQPTTLLSAARGEDLSLRRHAGAQRAAHVHRPRSHQCLASNPSYSPRLTHRSIPTVAAAGRRPLQRGGSAASIDGSLPPPTVSPKDTRGSCRPTAARVPAPPPNPTSQRPHESALCRG